MPLISVTGLFECDECGAEFSVPLEYEILLPAGWTVQDAAQDVAAQGVHLEDSAKPCSFKNDHARCPKCTEELDTLEEPEHEVYGDHDDD